MNQFPAYKQDDLFDLPFVQVMHLYDRAVEIVSGEKIEYGTAPGSIDDTDNGVSTLVKDSVTGNWI